MLSNRSQNNLIKALSISVKQVILQEIRESKTFSILIDETTDVSHAVRYVHDFKIKERFIQVCNIQSTRGEKLENVQISLKIT